MSHWQWGLPLLMKELLEQSARRRTYLVRVVYVAVLCYLAVESMQTLLRSATPLSVLGQGLPVLTSLVQLQFRGIYLVLPAMACSVFTIEKERNTLALLFLTRLGPWTIIYEKLLSRIFPMLMFLCCALPVMAFTYTLGGLTVFQLFVAAYFLIIAVFQIACVAVMCSALARSTAGAFVQTYVVLLLTPLASQIIGQAVPHQLFQAIIEVTTTWLQPGGSANNLGMPAFYAYGLHPMMLNQLLTPNVLCFNFFRNPWGFAPAATFTPWIPAILFGLPSITSGFGCLLITRWALYRRAFVAPGNPLLGFFRGIDKVFFWVNRNVAFDVKLVRESDTLPGDNPIAWREVSKRSLGQFRYLVRIMVPLLFPVIFVGMFIATSSANEWTNRGQDARLSPLVMFLWIASLVLIVVAAANAIPLERTRQTWDVLRSMPMNGKDMLRQKLRGVQRLQWVCSIPVFAAIGLEAWWRFQLVSVGLTMRQPGTRFPDDTYLWWEYVVGAVACVVLYAEQVKWIAMWCGLMIRNSMRAILTAAGAIAAIAIVPYWVLLIIVMSLIEHPIPGAIPQHSALSLLAMACPVSFVYFNEIGDLRTVSAIPLVPVAVHLLTQVTLLWLLRRHILGRAEWYLGRIGDSGRTRTRQEASGATVSSVGTELPNVAGAAT